MDFTTLIQNWYRQNKRDLPWRSENDPYKIWLSEVILQQTRVEQGTPYYLRFISAFPSVVDLAKAPEDKVLNLWQGLGYYSRARNLHAAAKKIHKEYHGVFPANYTDIRSLKGVGDYTAAAIASIAFHLPHAVVDGNVNRVLSRLYKITEPVDSNAGKKIIQQVAQELLDINNPGNHNQAMMELGSQICTPLNPLCNECPVSAQCLSFRDDSQKLFPIKKSKTKVRDRHLHYIVLTNGQNILIKKRNENDIWKGLYDFRLIEGHNDDETILELLRELNPTQISKDGVFKHILSHQKIHAQFWLVTVKSITPQKHEIIIPIKKLDDYPMPRLLIRYLERSLLHGRD